MESLGKNITVNLYIKHHVFTLALNLTHLFVLKLHISLLNKIRFCIVIVIVVLLVVVVVFFNNLSILSSWKIFNDLLISLVDNIEKLIPNHTYKILHIKNNMIT